jgi:ribosome modulation factor
MDEEYYNWIHAQDFTESDAREEGYRAYQAGSRSSDDNPFNNNEEWELRQAWNEGWSNAAWDD